MATRGWVLRGEGADLQIYEEEFSKNRLLTETPASYVEAKTLALKKLQSVVDRYSELANDDFAISGVLPPYKAWVESVSLGFRKSDRRFVVTAKTKKRAMEILNISRSSMEWSWRQCDGNWWYHLAHEEAIWAEEVDKELGGNGVFNRSLGREGAREIAQQVLAFYESMSNTELQSLLGLVKLEKGVSLSGIPYEIESIVRRADWPPNKIVVAIEVDDRLEWSGQASCCFSREVPPAPPGI